VSWLLLEHGLMDPAANMAWDEALLEAAMGLGQPVLRLYGWNQPAATFGYFQKHAEIARLTPLRPLIRRPTGGGLVPHDADWTYSLAFPPGHPWHELRATESYCRVHQWVQAAMAALGVPTSLAPEARSEVPGCCFAGAERFDVLLQDRKLAGAAQRRNRDGLLIQGSIQPPAGADRARFSGAMAAEGGRVLGGAGVALEPGAGLVARVAELAAAKYGQVAYNERR
jgi:lipoate-protein ligase A